MRIPVLNGVVTNEAGSFLTSFPTNREPVLRETGLSEGFLAVPPGIVQVATGPGPDRGGIAWNGACYRVMGNKLVQVRLIGGNWTVGVLGEIPGTNVCGFDYSFDNLIISGGGGLYYWGSDGFRQVTDPDLGPVIDAIWVDGYTMTTDGTSLIVTDLNDPMSVNPIKYGSAEESPDPVTGLVNMHGEVYVFGRYTTQVFQNVAGLGFPFQTIRTATVNYGCTGPRAKCKYADTIAFVGGEENAAPGVYLMGAGEAPKISTAEVDADLAALSDAELAAVFVEARVTNDDARLIVHLPDVSWSFSAQISGKTSVKTWCRYVTSKSTSGRYEGRGLVFAYGMYLVGASTGQIGYLSETTAQHYGEDVGWQFDTTLLYNEGRKGILGEMELVGTPGRGDADSRVFFSYTKDGETWSMERQTAAGKLGERAKRVAWRPGVRFENYMGLRFRGVDASLMGIARLEADIEALG